MATGKGGKGIGAAARTAFLNTLAYSVNVTKAAKAAGVTTAAIYRERERDAKFRAAWQTALCEGYARLEAQLLAEALVAASPKTSDAMLKARQAKHRLGLALLAAHRAAVRGERTVAAPHYDDAADAKARLRAKLAEMKANEDPA